MQLDLDARPGRPRRRRGLRLLLLAGVIASGAAAVNITLSAGARGAAETPRQADNGTDTPGRASIELNLPDARQSSTALATAHSPAGPGTIRQPGSKASLESPTQAETRKAASATPASQETSNEDATDTDIIVPEAGAGAGTDGGTSDAGANSTDDATRSATDNQEEDVEWRTLKVGSGDSLARLFNRAGLSARDVHDVLGAHERADQLRRLHPGDVIELKLSDNGELLALRYELSGNEILRIEQQASGYQGELLANELERRVEHGSAVIRRSLFDAGGRVGLSDSLLLDLADIFRWDIDFALDIRRGDAFTVIYEAFYRDGEKVRNGEILAAEFVNRGQAHRAVRYSNDAQQAEYYDPQGRSMRKAFLRTPVDFTRVSSGFDPNRMHPTLGERRAHMGTDYAAPPGTPIKATGDGRVIHRGWKSGYGRTIVLKHGGRYTTLYAHMSSYPSGLNAGDHVSQGQVIGYVGSSGRSTGPHLHYEFRVNGQHRNPRTVDLPDAQPIPERLRADFEAQTQSRLAELGIYSRFRLAAQGELLR